MLKKRRLKKLDKMDRYKMMNKKVVHMVVNHVKFQQFQQQMNILQKVHNKYTSQKDRMYKK